MPLLRPRNNKQELFTSRKRTVFSFINSDRSPCRRVPYFDMFNTSCFGPFTFTISLASLPPSFVNLVTSDLTDHSPCIPRRHPSLCPAFGLGGLDCISLHHSHHREWGGNMRDAADSREPKGTEEENSAEC